MIINHNMQAMNTNRQLGSIQGGLSKSMEKLSSGLRINRAGDDAAGLAISEKMRGQIRGLDQASTNSQDGISLIQTAEGALTESHSILQRMREVAVQSSNGTQTDDDRKQLQKELNQLTSELNRIGNTTEFNTKKLLNGGSGAGQTLAVKTKTESVNRTNASAELIFGTSGSIASDMSFGVSVGGEVLTVGIKAIATEMGLTDMADASLVSALEPTDKRNEFMKVLADKLTKALADNATVAGKATLTMDSNSKLTIQAIDNSTAVLSTGIGDVGTGITTKDVPAAPGTKGAYTLDIAKAFEAGSSITIAGKEINFAIGTTETNGVDTSKDDTAAKQAIRIAKILEDGQYTAAAVGNQITITERIATGATGPGATAGGGTFDIQLQVGANTGQRMQVSIDDMRASAIGVSSMNNLSSTITNDTGSYTLKWSATKDINNGTNTTGTEYALNIIDSESATAAITVIDDAIKTVSTQRASLGAYQNRLEHTINNLDNTSENLQAAESSIRDTNMAKEMMEYSKNNILSQAAQSMLAQANQSTQGVLSLLR